MHSRLTQGVRPLHEWKQRPPFSSGIVTGLCGSPQSGLNGATPPVEFGERNRDLALGHGRNEGRHRRMTGESRGFSRAAAPVSGFSRGTTPSSVSLSWGTRDPGLYASGEACASLLSSHGRGIGPRDSLKKDSPRLSRVAAGNPRFPRLVQVTSGSFSWCSVEVRETVKVGGASRGSTGFGALEEGLISS